MTHISRRSIPRLILLILLLQVLILSTAFAQGSGVKEVKLNNGLTVLMKEVHAAPVFTAQVWFNVGSRNEYTGITGISHILEHMLFNTSKHFKKGEISNAIRARGGIENAATWTDFTYYWQLLSSDNLEFSLKTLAERVGNAALLPNELAKERTVVLSEMEGRQTDPDSLLYEAVMAAAFEAHPYQWPVIGWRSDVENIDRNQLVNYYQKYYYPNNATLVLVGDFDSAKALQFIKKYFGQIAAHPLPRPMYTTEPKQRGIRRVTVRREGNAERVIMGYHVPAISDPDTYPLMVLDQILSGGRSSRLYQALVENQLATSAWSSSGARKDPSLFMLGATGRHGVSVDVLEKSLREQVEKAKTTLPSSEEMQAARNQLQAYITFQNDSVSDQGEQLGYYNTVANWRYLNTLLPKVNAVTPEDVRRVAQKYLDDENLTAGYFIPTDGGGGVVEAAPVGPLQKSLLPDPSKLAYYTKPAKSTPAKSVKTNASKSVVRPHRIVLDNGMTVIVQENPSNPTVAISGNLKAGSYFDGQGKAGTADLVAEMIGRGTETRSALDLAKASEFVGADINTSAGVESASFSAQSLSKDFPLMLDLLSDELRNANFPQDQLDRAKGEMMSNLEQSKESPEARAMRAFYNKIFPVGHPYYEPTVEEAQKELSGITRDDLVNFYSKYYRPDTAAIVIVGDVKTDEAVSLVKKYFGDWKAVGPKPEMSIPTISPSSKTDKVVINLPDQTEVSVIYGYPMGVKRTDPDYYAVRIMNQILGGGGALGSVLGEEIREKRGLVYDVYSTYSATLGAGPWYATLGTAPKNADMAIDTLKQQIEKFKKQGATPQQFKQAREFIVGVFPIALETNSGVANALLSAEFYGLGMDYLHNYSKIYRSVTLDQVNAAAKKYLRPDSATLVIAGPYKGK